MSDAVNPVTDLPVKSTSALKRWSKRTAVVAVATTVLAAIYLKVQNKTEDGTETSTT